MATVNMCKTLLKGRILNLNVNVLEGEVRRRCVRVNKNVLFSSKPPPGGRERKVSWKFAMGSVGLGIAAGAGYAYYNIPSPQKTILNEGWNSKRLIIDKLPEFTPARKVTTPVDHTGLDLVLYQYPTCPFCCKVRAFLDYYGFSYSVIEVNPVLRQQMKWSEYKKVPILLAKVENGYQQMNDSSVIISALTTYLNDQHQNLTDILNFYPPVSFSEPDGKVKTEVMNRYFLMFQESLPPGRTNESLGEERKWRKWADDVLVHTLSPNVYRTLGESLQSFKWFSQVGEWERLFSSWECYLIVYVGALAMWIIGKRLKKRHNLKDDVRISLYDECNHWVRQLNKKGSRFMGGDSPNLADLAVYGVLSSIRGCAAFEDLLRNTKIGSWYGRMQEVVENHSGAYSYNLLYRGQAI
ncbi:prostaglandin E synthase 2 [Ischnura elegans]|uniref:prostaglandin E synthase 2 n=1 Tax=Ischnura elegans TaxID=197161 RepID=UPI001ED88382|nr:prostaglandin E synthase 2 [Ischnura elegans]